MQDSSNNINNQFKGQNPPTRPLFAPTPAVPQGKNLIGDNPFYNYLNPAPAGTPVKQVNQTPFYTNNQYQKGLFRGLPIYRGEPQYYQEFADVLWNDENEGLHKFDPLNIEHNQEVQSRLHDNIDRSLAKILTNPGENYQTKEYIDKSLEHLLRDPRYLPYQNIIKLEQKKIQQDREEYAKLKEEEENLRETYNDYGAFQEGVHEDLTNLVGMQTDNNLLLEPNLEHFPKTSEYFSYSGLNPDEYNTIFNTRREGFWDKFFGSGDSEANELEKMYKGLRLFSKKPQAFEKFLADVKPEFVDWIKKHYTKGVEGKGAANLFDTDLKFAVSQIYKDLLKKQGESNNAQDIEKKIENWEDENTKDVFRNDAIKESAFDFADELTELMKSQKKLPQNLNEQLKDIDLDNFVLGNKNLNNFLYQFLKNTPYNNWQNELSKYLKRTFIPYFNQNLSFGNTINKLVKTIEDKVQKAGGIEKFLVDNIKNEKEQSIIPTTSKTSQGEIERLKKTVEFLKKNLKKTDDTKVIHEIVKDLSDNLAKEVVKQAHEVQKKPLKVQIENQEADNTFGTTGWGTEWKPGENILSTEEVEPSPELPVQEKEFDLNNIEDLGSIYNTYIEGGLTSIFDKVTNAFDKFKDYVANKYEEDKNKNAQATATALERQKQREKKFEEVEKYFGNIVEYVQDTYNNFPSEELKEAIDEKFNEFQTYTNNKLQTITDDFKKVREDRRKQISENQEEHDKKVNQALQDIVTATNRFKKHIDGTINDFIDNSGPKVVNLYNKLKVYADEVLQGAIQSLSPMSEEELLNKFAYQNEYIEQSLNLDIETITENAADILTEELKQQDLSFNPDTIKDLVKESIKPSVIEDVIIKNETIVEEAKQEIEQKQKELVEIISKQITSEPLKVSLTNDNEEDFITFGTPNYISEFPEDLTSPQQIPKEEQSKLTDYLSDITNVLGEIDFITKRMIEQEAIKKNSTPAEVINEIQEAIVNKPVEDLKPIEKIYYNDTLLNDQVKGLENNFVDKDNQPLKLNGNKEADLTIDSAKQVYDDVLARKAQEQYHHLLKNKYTIEQINILKPFRKELDAIGDSSYPERFRSKSLLQSKWGNTYDPSSVPRFYVNEKLQQQQQQYFLKQSLEKAKQDNDIEKVLALDYLDNFLKDSIKNYEEFLAKKPEAFKQIKEILNQAQPLMEKKILDEEIKPALTNYVNFSPTNNMDLKNSIKELGNAITGLTQEQLHTAIQNLPEEDRNKLTNKVTNDLNTILDAVKEYAPEVMESFDKIVEAQNLEKMVQSYQASPEVLQNIENEVIEILGEDGLTQQVAEDKIIETTQGKDLKEIEGKINNIKSIFGDIGTYIPSTDTKGLQIGNGASEFIGNINPIAMPNIYANNNGAAKDATLDLFEIDQLLRILYPIFKEIGIDISDYDIENPNKYYNWMGKIIHSGQAYETQLRASAFAGKYRDAILPKFEELKNTIQNLPNFPEWLAQSTLEPNLEKAVETAKEHGATDPSIDEFMNKYKEYQETMKLLRQRMEELFKLHAAFAAAESEEEDDSMLGSILGAVIGAIAAFATPWGAGILTPSILAGTAAGTATSVGLGAIGGATLGGTLQGMLGAKEYGNSGEVRNDINQLDNVMKEYYQKSNEAQTMIRKKIIELGTKKE